MISQNENPLQQEHQNCSFSVTKMQHILYNGVEKFQTIKQARELIANDPLLKFDPAQLSLSREEILTLYLKKSIRYLTFEN